ncbi:MAG TPA: SDR family oxidoreductase [Solirubrobacteraceae bacterium]|nr:SDR family oxidoreductase [Solirubrobacteraceae bacterium]
MRLDGSPRSLAGRAAIVTGASRGIGRGIALELGASGASVAVGFRRDTRAASETVSAIRAAGGRAIAVQASMSDPGDVDALAEAALSEFGYVDIVVNSAGDGGRGLGVADTYPAELRRLMTIYAFSAARLAQILLPQMRARPRADIVMISSSELRDRAVGDAGYRMAIAALEALAVALADEESRHGVRVNILAPGLVATENGLRRARSELGTADIPTLEATHPLGRLPRPADLARVVRFLVSDEAGFVTGQRIVIGGGAYAPVLVGTPEAVRI